MEQDELVFAHTSQLTWLRDACVPEWSDWDRPSEPESPVHRIHPYPAKFPAHIPARAIELARRSGRRVNRIGDVFCGCGTVAYEARRHGLQFWGCDINPVAALIARVKSGVYTAAQVQLLADRVQREFQTCAPACSLSASAQQQLQRWFAPEQFDGLARLRQAIAKITQPASAERDLLDCAFSSCLRPTSLWRSRATKPSIDLGKVVVDPLHCFVKQMRQFASAWSSDSEVQVCERGPRAEVTVASATDVAPPDRRLDLLVSSPPYVTSYEYADLHQLSLLWLGYVDDHRSLRPKMVGSSSNKAHFASAYKRLNDTACHLSFSIFGKDEAAAAAVAKYYLDMQAAVLNSVRLLADDGLAVFIVGNVTLKGIEMDNARHVAEAMLESGYRRVRVGRRAVTNKKNTSYRSFNGQLTSDPTQRRVYSHEYILVGEK